MSFTPDQINQLHHTYDKSQQAGKNARGYVAGAVAAGVGGYGAASVAKMATHGGMADWHRDQAKVAEKAGDKVASGFHRGMQEFHIQKAASTGAGKVLSSVGKGVADGAKIARSIFKSDEENTMSAFGTDPLIKFFQASGLEKAKLAETLVKVSGIQGVIQANVERWNTEEGAKDAVAYLDESDLRKAVYLDMYDRGGEELAKADGDKINWLTEIAQYAEYTLNKSQPSIVDISFRASPSSPGAMNGNSGTPASGASADYGTPTPPNTSASATYGKYQSDSAAKPINNAAKVTDPEQTKRAGKGKLLAAFKAAIKSTTNPISTNETNGHAGSFAAPTGTDLDTTGGTSLTRSEGTTELQKSISATIASRLHAHADSLAAAVAGGASGIQDTAGRLNKSGFAASIRGRGPYSINAKSVASADQSSSPANPAND